MLERIQRGLEALYRIETDVSVLDFVIDESVREIIDPERRAREQLFVTAEGDVALYVCEGALARLADGPDNPMLDHNLDDFLLVLEGVSHFVYTAWRARADHRVTALELELQAEVDKFVTCVLSQAAPRKSVERSRWLRERLFERVEFDHDLDPEEVTRYRVANNNALRYARSLERRFVTSGRIVDMLRELRDFYRLSARDKLSFIKAAA